MTYTPNVPNSGESLGFTRDLIRGNFQVLNTAFSVNHVALSTSGQGKHKFVEMPNGGFPSGLIGNQGTIYCKSSGGAQMFYTQGAFGKEYQLTRANADPLEFPTFGTNSGYDTNETGGWTFLPGGMLFQYGLRISAGTSGLITFPTDFTNPPYSITVSLYSNAAGRTVVVDTATPPTKSEFKFITSISGQGIFWTAIGV